MVGNKIPSSLQKQTETNYYKHKSARTFASLFSCTIMAVIHFLNVKQGDCSCIQYNSGRVSVIDVFNASKPLTTESLRDTIEFSAKSVRGNFNQKEHPVNPIEYLQQHKIQQVFRFILTHPDMDHMGGIKDFFETFYPTNLWDTDNTKEMGSFTGSPYSEEDWQFYKDMRSGAYDKTKRLTLFAGAKGQFYNTNENGNSGGDGLYILAPTPDLVEEANRIGDFNDCSYVILYRSGSRRIIFGGDSHDKTWDYILSNYESHVKDVDLLIAPHHGRDSGRSFDFLDTVRPKITFFGNANSVHLAYSAWNNRKLPFITNNQGNCLLADINSDTMSIYATYENFARKFTEKCNYQTYYENKLQAWFLGQLP